MTKIQAKKIQVQSSKIQLTPAEKAIRDILDSSKDKTYKEQIERLAQLLLDYPELNPDKKVANQLLTAYKAGLLQDKIACKYLKQGKLPLDAIRKAVVLTPAAKAWEDAMTQYLLLNLKLKPFTKARNQEDKTPMDLQKQQQYGGLEVTKAMVYAKLRYGAMDKKSGQRLEFLLHFNYKFSFLKKNILDNFSKEVDDTNHAIKQIQLHDFLCKKYLAAGLNPEKVPTGYINEAKLQKCLDVLMADEKLRREAFALLALNHAEASDQGNEDEDEYTEAPTVSSVDRYQFQQYSHRAENAEKVLYMLELGNQLVDSKGTPNNKADFAPFVTLQALPLLAEFQAEDHMALLEFMDLKLLRFLKSHEIPRDPQHQDRNAEVYAAYLGLAYNTARKRFKALQKLLATVGDKAHRAVNAISKVKQQERKACEAENAAIAKANKAAAEKRKAAADKRKAAADKRKAAADKRKAAADKRKAAADKRKAAADKRKTAAEKAKATADKREAASKGKAV